MPLYKYVLMKGQPWMRISVLAVIPFCSPLSFRHGEGALPYLSDTSACVNGITKSSIFSPTSNIGPYFRSYLTAISAECISGHTDIVITEKSALILSREDDLL